MYKVLKGVPVTPVKGARKYPFPDMEVGDCFEVPVNPNTTYARHKVQTNIATVSSTFGKVHGMEFVTRQDVTAALVRCWRVS